MINFLTISLLVKFIPNQQPLKSLEVKIIKKMNKSVMRFKNLQSSRRIV